MALEKVAFLRGHASHTLNISFIVSRIIWWRIRSGCVNLWHHKNKNEAPLILWDILILRHFKFYNSNSNNQRTEYNVKEGIHNHILFYVDMVYLRTKFSIS